MFSLDNKVAIVTGGAGHLGSAISKTLAQAGANVYAVGRDAEKLGKLKDSKINTRELDVLDLGQFQSFVSEIVDRHGAIDCLVNNASAANRETWEKLDEKAWHEGLRGALDPYFLCTKAVSEHMLKKQSGSIINVSSVLGELAPQFPMHLDLGNAASAHHSVAKGGVIQLTKHLAALWAQKGIRVNCVSPGYFPRKKGVERPDFIKELNSRIPMGRIGQPEEFSPIILFLASSGASYITGQNFVVDGGYSIW